MSSRTKNTKPLTDISYGQLFLGSVGPGNKNLKTKLEPSYFSSGNCGLTTMDALYKWHGHS